MAQRIIQIKLIANKYNVSVAQLCIKYVLDLGLIALPKTENREHMITNAQVDFTISKEDMEELNSLKDAIDYGKDKVFPVFSGK